LKAELIRHLARKIVGLIAEPREPHLRQIAKNGTRRAVSQRMGFAHISRPDQGKA